MKVFRIPLMMACVLTGAALPAVAQSGTFSLPANCTAYLTVQKKNCSLSHHFTCSGDPEGHQQRVDMDDAGLSYMGSIDAETQWISSYHPFSGHSETLAPDPADPASFSELVAKGRDDYDFRTFSPEIGESHYVGRDILTGDTVVIDGVSLDVTDYAIRALDAQGNERWRSAGTEFISRDWRMFLSGTGRIVTPDGSFESDDSPVEFIFPGESGFLSVNPKYGCGEMMSHAIQDSLIPAALR